jgi:hypothetical protein
MHEAEAVARAGKILANLVLAAYRRSTVCVGQVRKGFQAMRSRLVLPRLLFFDALFMSPDPVQAKPPARAAGLVSSAYSAGRSVGSVDRVGLTDAVGAADPVRPTDAANAARHGAAADPACAACQIGASGMAAVAEDIFLPRSRVGRGSWLLASAVQRMAVAVLVSAALWGLTAWAMGWW